MLKAIKAGTRRLAAPARGYGRRQCMVALGCTGSDKSMATVPPSPPEQPHPPAAAKLQQNFNAAGIRLFLRIARGQQHLALPHVAVTDIRWLNWAALRDAGFRGCVFDKDNTLTEPYADSVSAPLRHSLAECLRVFGRDKVALYSNSAGLAQFDPQGAEAARLEAALGVHVLRHREKKPAGGSQELLAHFGCAAEELVMIGDRYLTDVVFGNRHGMLTVRPAPLTLAGEPPGVAVARRVENHFVAAWLAAGHRAQPHPLIARLSDGQLAQLVREPPPH